VGLAANGDEELSGGVFPAYHASCFT